MKKIKLNVFSTSNESKFLRQKKITLKHKNPKKNKKKKSLDLAKKNYKKTFFLLTPQTNQKKNSHNTLQIVKNSLKCVKKLIGDIKKNL